MSKFVLMVTVQEDKAACGTEHLAGVVETGIEGGGPCYAPPMVTKPPEGLLGVFLVDARNSFNDENLMAML